MKERPDIDDLARKLAGNLSPEQMRERWEERQVAAGAAFNREKTETERAYWEKVFGAKPVSQPRPTRRFDQSPLTFDAAWEEFAQLLEMRASEIRRLTEEPFEWVFSDAETNIVKNIVRYFVNDEAACFSGKKCPLGKGLFVYGGVGTGKTEIMQMVGVLCKSHNLAKAFRLTSMSATYIEAKTNSGYDPVSENIMYDRLFDEFGRHAGAVVRFGDQLDINEAVVELRYERWKRYGQLSHFIANAQPNDLESLFSPMIFDRLREMCTSVLFPGKSKRK